MDLETYDEEMDGIDDVLLDERLKKISPEWWCRIESYQLADLLRTHVRLALETGTDLGRVKRLLEKVRRATLDATTEGTNHG